MSCTARMLVLSLVDKLSLKNFDVLLGNKTCQREQVNKLLQLEGELLYEKLEKKLVLFPSPHISSFPFLNCLTC